VKDSRPAVARTPLGRLVAMEEVAEFLLRNGGIAGQDLNIDGGRLLI
jgi:hypothetical protein